MVCCQYNFIFCVINKIMEFYYQRNLVTKEEYFCFIFNLQKELKEFESNKPVKTCDLIYHTPICNQSEIVGDRAQIHLITIWWIKFQIQIRTKSLPKSKRLANHNGKVARNQMNPQYYWFYLESRVIGYLIIKSSIHSIDRTF